MLGIRDTKINNLAILAKTCWRCLDDDNLLCSKTLKEKYRPRSDLWEAKFWKGDSWFWRGFVEGVGFIYDRVGWIIGNGKKISIWNHNWIPSKEGLRKPLSNITNLNPYPILPTWILKWKVYKMIGNETKIRSGNFLAIQRIWPF